MKKISTLLIITISLSVLAGSCKKNILDTQPQTSISEEVAFSTPAKILAQVNNLYSRLEHPGFYGGRQVLFNEQRGEEFSQNDPNTSVGAGVWGQNALSNDNLLNNVWSKGYAAINASNILISQLGKSTVIPTVLREQYTGEAKFVRAFAYLVLVQTFAQPYAKDNGASAGLPLRLNAETSEGGNDLTRSTTGEIYAQIFKDLNEAENALPESYATNALNSSRAHKASAIALKTRAYLVKGDYDNVITEAKKIVSTAAPFVYTSGAITHKLETNFSTVFTGSYVGPESVFSLPFNNVDAPDVQSALAASYAGAVVLALNPQGILSNAALSSATSADARKNLVVTKSGQKILLKFPKITVPYTDYIPVIRFAEVLLNYAEAAAETGETSLATSLLYAVRKRSDPAYVFADENLLPKETLVRTILTERRIELLGEGFRTPDLQRRLETLPSKSGAAGTAPAVAPNAGNYIWPLPSDEIATNKLILK